MPTERRIRKVERVLAARMSDLRVVLEEVTNTHNASAVVRTCDAAGVMHVDVISSAPEGFPLNEAVTTGAEKWLNLTRFGSTRRCLRFLKDRGFRIAATHLGPESVAYTEVDYTLPTAIVFGNEAAGISAEAKALADHIIKIPMSGMVQSLNLSVSVGIILYEALRQRRRAGHFAGITLQEMKDFRRKWLKLGEP